MKRQKGQESWKNNPENQCPLTGQPECDIKESKGIGSDNIKKKKKNIVKAGEK